MFTLRDVLDMAIQIERNGEAVYRRARARATDPEMIEMLDWMADEEARHARCFSEIRQTLPVEGDNVVLDELGKLMMATIVGNRSFSLEEVDFSRIEEVNDLLAVMVAFERDTAAFYSLFRNLLAVPSEQARLDEIITEEESHIRRLEECRDKNLACLKT